MKLRHVVAAAGIAGAGVALHGALRRKPAAESKESIDRRMAWWREARFGMFIHWGLYAIPAGAWKGIKFPGYSEWLMNAALIPDREYSKLAAQFNPVKFDAGEWVRTAKNAGMKYIVITAKHHDGFCMYDSKVSDYNIVKATPFGRDPLAELAAACKDEGIRFGLYYSILDWHHSLMPGHFGVITDFSKYFDYMKQQLEELLTNYGPVSVLFFDGDWQLQWSEAKGREITRLLRRLQPGIVINNRVGRRSLLCMIPQAQKFSMNTTGGDYETPEQFTLDFIPRRDWETNMTLNGNWGYSSYDDNWKSPETLIRTLIHTAGKGGNFLLNVGPDAEGVIPAPSVERLAQVGEWLKYNGESIYGTTAGPLQNLPWGRSTQKGDNIYLHVHDWPRGELKVQKLEIEIKTAKLINKKKRLPLEFSTARGGIKINLPDTAPDAVSSTIVLET